MESSRIIVGCCGEVNYGPLKPNSNPNFKLCISKSTVDNVVHYEVCNKWVVVFNYENMTRDEMPKSLIVLSDESGIPLNDINNDSVAVNIENFMEAKEVYGVDPDSLN